jgi:hypothetical protein
MKQSQKKYTVPYFYRRGELQLSYHIYFGLWSHCGINYQLCMFLYQELVYGNALPVDLFITSVRIMKILSLFMMLLSMGTAVYPLQ